jgi:hypothetical protein
MTSTTETKPSPRAESDSDLLRRTLRMVGVLVALCVIFVGALSVAAVAITTRAVSAGAPAKPADTAETAKKPLSI